MPAGLGLNSWAFGLKTTALLHCPLPPWLGALVFFTLTTLAWSGLGRQPYFYMGVLRGLRALYLKLSKL